MALPQTPRIRPGRLSVSCNRDLDFREVRRAMFVAERIDELVSEWLASVNLA